LAKVSKSLSFKNATISLNGETLVIKEYDKNDDYEEYDLLKVLSEWIDVYGVSITVKHNSDLV